MKKNCEEKNFQECFHTQVCEKTRILVTHTIDFLHLEDQIIIIKDGKIVFCGPFQEAKENPFFKELVRIFKSHQT